MRVITLDRNKKIIGVKSVGDSYVAQENEIATELGEQGQIMQEDGTFIDVPIESIEVQATIEEQILAENQYQTALLEMQMLGGM